MRLLEFNVNAQHLSKDPQCDFDNLVAGTKKYLKASFTFSPEWDDCQIVASFWRGSSEHAAIVKNGVCEIPPEVLVGRTFSLYLVGRRSDGYDIITNDINVRQGVSK